MANKRNDRKGIRRAEALERMKRYTYSNEPRFTNRGKPKPRHTETEWAERNAAEIAHVQTLVSRSGQMVPMAPDPA